MKKINVINLLDRQNQTSIYYNIDLPGESAFVNNNSLAISGWVSVDFTKYEEKIAVVVIYGNGSEVSLPLDCQRDDAARHMRITRPNVTWLVKGFSSVLDKAEDFTVYLRTSAKDSVAIFRASVEEYGVYEMWSEFIKTSEVLSPLPSIDKASLLDQLVQLKNDKRFLRYKDITSFLSDSEYSSAKKSLFRQFIETLSNDYFVEHSIASSIENSCITVYMPHIGKLAKCIGSFHIAQTNVLHFSYEGGAFFVLQHVSSCDAIFMANECLFVGFCHITLDNGLLGVVKYFEHAILNGSNKVSYFSGILASHGRPYHFHYDVGLAVRKIFELGLLSQIPRYIQLSGADFCGVDQLYKTGCPEKDIVADSRRINQIAKNESGYFFHVGYLYHHEKHKKIRLGYDAKITHLANVTSSASRDYDLKLLSEKRVVWFGVTGQKRAWIEQIEACIALMNRLSDGIDDLAIVFDGWTSPMHPSKADKCEIDADMQVVNLIKDKLNSNIATFSVVGENSLVKIRFAQLTHFFIANQATGSMHIARFANKPGVTHISNDFYKETINQHVLNQAEKIPSSLIKDIPNPDNPRMDFTSYSIDVDDFLNYCIPLAREALSINV